MNVFTTNPIIYSNTEGDETSSTTSPKKGINTDVLKSGTDILTAVATGLVGRQRQYTDAEQRCGKRPKLQKNRKTWQKCVDAGASTPTYSNNTNTNTTTDTEKESTNKKPMSKGLKIGLIAGGVVLLGVIGFIIYKKSK